MLASFNPLFFAIVFILSIISPLLLLIIIVDCLAVRSYYKLHSPPWKLYLITNVSFNVIFFSLAWIGLSQAGGGMGVPLIVPIALILMLFDILWISPYIYTRLHHRNAKIIFFTVVLSVSLSFLACIYYVIMINITHGQN